jgi:hypothetical protein
VLYFFLFLFFWVVTKTESSGLVSTDLVSLAIAKHTCLYLFCGFSEQVLWSNVLQKGNIMNPPISLDDVISLGCSSGGRKTCRLICAG